MTTKFNKTALFAALNKFVDDKVALITSVRSAGYKTLEEARPDVMEWVCTRVKGVSVATRGSQVVFKGDKAKCSDARSSLRDMMLNIQGTTRRKAAAATAPKESGKPVPMTKTQRTALELAIAAFGSKAKLLAALK
jgi:hypothetical protein